MGNYEVINSVIISDLSRQLDEHDASQGLWEIDGSNFDNNAAKVLSDLETNVLERENHSNPGIIQTIVAPIVMQHALRLRRWAELSPEELDLKPRVLNRIVAQIRPSNHMPMPLLAYREAGKEIAGYLDSDQPKEAIRHDTASWAGSLLIYGADMQAYKHRFNLVEAFNERLRFEAEVFEPTASPSALTVN